MVILHYFRMTTGWKVEPPKDIWPNLFNDCNFPWKTVKQFTQDLPSHEILFRTATLSKRLPFLPFIPNCSSNHEDLKIWNLENSKNLSVCSFYKYLIDGCLQSALYPQFWKTECPSKISFFCQLASEDRILNIVNIAKKDCNTQSATNTYVLCHKDSETADHLLLQCEVSE